MDKVRVRFAPSPTGYLHIGGARTALFNWFFARQHHGTFILRIEDTDTERLKEDSVSQILSSMKWLGMDWDEGPEVGGNYGPYYQSERLELYRREAQRLVQEGKAYYCFCSHQDLEQAREQQRQAGKPFRYSGKCRNLDPQEAQRRVDAGEKAVIRIKIPADGTLSVQDIIRGQVSFSLDQLDDMIIMKSNQMPAYNFACCVDDHAMAMTHVIRAEEHLSNTPKQVLIYQALGYDLPQFAHLSMILAPDRSKLSKRHGATSVEEFRGQGFLASAITNYLTLLGWSPGNDQEIVSPAETIRQFTLDKVSRNAAIYDIKKLTWINGHYLSDMAIDDVVDQAIPFIIQKGLVSEQQVEQQHSYIHAVIACVRERVKTLQEVADAADYFFRDVEHYDDKGFRKQFMKDGATELLTKTRTCLAKLQRWDTATTEEAYRTLAEELGIKAGELIHPTRLALTGRTVSPGLFDVMVLLGQQRCLDRLDKAILAIRAAIQ